MHWKIKVSRETIFLSFEIFFLLAFQCQNNKEKIMKKSLLILVVLFSFILMSCGCDEENPEARITNNGTGKASVQIQTSGGNTVNINNIEVGATSAWTSFSPGNCTFTVAIQGVADPIVKVINLTYCKRYEIKVNSNNTISFTTSDM